MELGNYILTVFFFIVCSFAANGQNKTVDSLKRVLQSQKEDTNKVNTLNAISTVLTDSVKYNEALKYANEALGLSEKINFKSGQAKTYKIIASIYEFRGDYVTSRNNYLLGKKIYEELKDKSRVADFTNSIAVLYYREGDLAEAIKISYNTLKFYDELQDKSGAAYTYLVLGQLYYTDKNYPESLKNFQLSLKLSEELGNKMYIAYCKLGIGRIDAKNKNYTEALRKYSEVLKVFEEVNDITIAETHRCMGELFESLGTENKTTSKDNYSKAVKHYMQNLSIYQNIKDKGGIATAYYYVGKINVTLGNFETARTYLKQGLQVAEEIRSKGDLQDIYLSLSVLDSAEGNYKQAHEHYKNHILYRDSISNEETKKKLVRASMQYEFDKKEAAAKAEQNKKDEAARRTRNLQYFAIGVVLLIAVFLFIYSRQKQKAKAKIEKAYSDLKSAQQQLIQSEKMASLGELTAGIAHEIQNPLNFVNNFSDVNKELADELEQEMNKGNYTDAKAIAKDIKDNEQKINHHGKRADAIVKGMLQHSRTSSGQKEPTDINALADEYLRLAYHGMRAKDKSFNTNTKTEFDSHIGKINVVPQDIGRVILNLINNAFYAVSEKQKQNLGGYEPTVSVSTTKHNSKVEIKVKDNGNGIPQKIVDKIFQPFFTTKPTGQGTGLGLSLAYDIITKGHGGELKVETKEGEGSEFVIQLPFGN